MKYNLMNWPHSRLPFSGKSPRDCNQKYPEYYEVVYYTIPARKDMNINRNIFLERMAEWDRITQGYQKSLKHLRSELSRVEQRERSRLAGELHDYLAQMLVVSKMKLDVLKKKTDPEAQQSIIHELEELMDQSIHFTRTLMSDLSPKVLHEEGLLAALQKLKEQMKQHGLEVILEQEIQELNLDEEKSTQLYQMVRELLFNVLKHAQVKKAILRIAVQNTNKLVLTVKDEGIGFSVTDDTSEIHTQKGFGLWSIGERIESLGGEFHIQSAPNQGADVTLIMPLNR